MKVTLPDGREADFEEVEFETINEDWNEYELEDGEIVKVKTVVQKIMRATNTHNEAGDPLYQIASQNVVTASNIPQEFRESDADSEGDN